MATSNTPSTFGEGSSVELSTRAKSPSAAEPAIGTTVATSPRIAAVCLPASDSETRISASSQPTAWSFLAVATKNGSENTTATSQMAVRCPSSPSPSVSSPPGGCAPR